MKILIDIGHPAHVHYFKNYYKLLKNEGHEFLIFARNRKAVFDLLEYYNMSFISRGKGYNSLVGKVLYFFIVVIFMFLKSRKFQPDMAISFSSGYISLVSFLLGAKNIVIDDTEHAKFEQMVYKPFASIIITPSTFKKNFGEKHLKINSTTDNLYLNPKYYDPDNSIFQKLGIGIDSEYCILRFVSWQASHDIGHKGLSLIQKLELIKELEKKYVVFVSTEDDPPKDLLKYEFPLNSYDMHHAIYYASVFIGESGTMATEAAFLGTPSIMFNSSSSLFGVIDYYKEHGLLFTPKDFNALLKIICELHISNRADFRAKASLVCNSMDDFTSLILEKTLEFSIRNKLE